MELEMNYQDEFNYFHNPMSPLHQFPFDGLNLQGFSSSGYPMEENHDFFTPQTTNNIGLPFEEGIINSSTCKVELERPKKQRKTNTYASLSTQTKSTSPYSSPLIISFENSSSSPVSSQAVEPKKEEGYPGLISSSDDQFGSVYYIGSSKKSGPPNRCRILAKEHVIAERKRREKLSQRFIALSAVVPGLKKAERELQARKSEILSAKLAVVRSREQRCLNLDRWIASEMCRISALRSQLDGLDGEYRARALEFRYMTTMDKVSVLGEAVKYLNHLQERVKSLEEQATRKTVDSALLMKRSYVNVDDEPSPSDDKSNSCTGRSLLPQVEARVSGKDVLVRIHCEMNMGGVAKILGEVEKLGLNVTSSSIIPFGSSILDLTFVAQMEANFSTSVRNLVRNLRQAIMGRL